LLRHCCWCGPGLTVMRWRREAMLLCSTVAAASCLWTRDVAVKLLPGISSDCLSRTRSTLSSDHRVHQVWTVNSPCCLNPANKASVRPSARLSHAHIAQKRRVLNYNSDCSTTGSTSLRPKNLRPLSRNTNQIQSRGYCQFVKRK